MATILSGATFGAAMIAAGFYNPAVVIAQLKFENWHMVQAFLAATASSMYVRLQRRLLDSPFVANQADTGPIVSTTMLQNAPAM